MTDWSLVSAQGAPQEWSLRLPLETYEDTRGYDEAREYHPESRATLTQGPDGFRLTVDDRFVGVYPDVGDGMVAGNGIHASRTAVIAAGAFAASGLSADRWRFEFMAFHGVYDRTEVIRPMRDGWRSEIGSLKLPVQSTAGEAERLLDATQHVQIDILNGLEAIYLGRYASKNVAFHLRDRLYSEETSDGRLGLTSAGIAVMDSDPRTIPSALKEIILSRVVAIETERVAREGEDAVAIPTPILSFRDACYQIGSHLSVDSSGGGTLSFLEAVRDGLELWADVALSEPHEEIVTATGTYANGNTARDLTVLLMAPSWAGDRSRLLAEAIVDVQHDLRAALGDVPASPSRSFV